MTLYSIIYDEIQFSGIDLPFNVMKVVMKGKRPYLDDDIEFESLNN